MHTRGPSLTNAWPSVPTQISVLAPWQSAKETAQCTTGIWEYPTNFPLSTTIIPLTGQGKLEPRTSTIQEMTQWEKDPECSLLPSCPVTVTSPPPAVIVSCFPAALTPLSHYSSPGHLHQDFIWRRGQRTRHCPKNHSPGVLLTTCFLETLRSYRTKKKIQNNKKRC